MKIEFNGNGFCAEANLATDKHNTSPVASGMSFMKHSCLLFSFAAFIFALTLLPFGLFVNVSTDLLRKLTEFPISHYITVLCIVSFIIAAISMICGVLSAILFFKSQKRTSDITGMIMSVFSFVLCICNIVFGIVGLFA